MENKNGKRKICKNKIKKICQGKEKANENQDGGDKLNYMQNELI